MKYAFSYLMKILNTLYFYDTSNYDEIKKLIYKTAIKTYQINKDDFIDKECHELINLMNDICQKKVEEELKIEEKKDNEDKKDIIEDNNSEIELNKSINGDEEKNE